MQAHDDEQKCVVGDVVKITSAGRCVSHHSGAFARMLARSKEWRGRTLLLSHYPMKIEVA